MPVCIFLLMYVDLINSVFVGAKCSSHDDCSDELACTNGVCA